MIDTIFSKLVNDKLADWGVVLLGITGLPGANERLSPASIATFANLELERMSMEDPVLDLVVELATDDNLPTADAREKLWAICEAKQVDLEVSKRKWQLALLSDLLSDPESDPVYGMIALNEFWGAWEWPEDCPRTIKDDSEMSPDYYHSNTHYEFVLNDHKNWLAEKLAVLSPLRVENDS